MLLVNVLVTLSQVAKKLKKHSHRNYPIVLTKNKNQLTQNFSMMKRVHIFLKKYALCLNIIYQELRLLC